MADSRPVFWWLPDALTLVRVPMGACAFLLVDWPWALFALMAAAAITDMLDGWTARRMHLKRGHGAWLDPVCDKVFVLCVIATLWIAREPQWYVMLLIAMREVLQAPLVIALFIAGHGRSYNFRAAIVGKLATVVQFAALTVVVFDGNALPWAIAACVIGVLAIAQYVMRLVIMRW